MAGRALALSMLWLAALPAAAQTAGTPGLADLSIEELADLTITSVSRRAERLSDAAASAFVITQDDIRRSGATSLPEALRLAPNLQVARIDATQYAISARGFNNAIGNKLLVLIDGRTVYSPLFSGVFWDQQDVMLEDVERIEVVSGPGGTLWGANAVNGVINVITRSSRDTQGGLVALGAGNLEQGASYRYGGKLDDGGAYRLYAKAGKIQNTETAGGIPIPDGTERAQAGFRSDWGGKPGAYTLQGDAYSGKAEPRAGGLRPIEYSGANLLGRWTSTGEDGSETRVQAYYDHAERDDQFLYRPRTDILDLEAQRSVRLGAHAVVWGGGYRYAHDDLQPGIFFAFVPVSRSLNWANAFVQDSIALTKSLRLTAGIKLEHNDYTGVEPLPNLRLAWKAAEEHLLWGAVSRAVRAPARLDHDIRLPPSGAIIAGGSTFESEVANVFELGYRGALGRVLTYSVTAFHYDWDKLRSGQLPPAQVQNRIEGTTDGIEFWGAWQVLPAWRLSGGFTTLAEDLHTEPGAGDPTGPSALGNDPNYQWQIRSSHSFAYRQELDIMLRRVAALPNPAVPAYNALDIRYGWRVRPDLELSATVQNLVDPGHVEFGAAPGRSEFARGVFLKARWTY